MVRIPQYDSDRALGTGSEFFRPQSEEAARDIQRGLSQFGQGVENLGEARFRMQERQEKFQTEKALLDLDVWTARKVDDELQRIPEGGAGFHDKVIADVNTETQRVLDSLPESQRQAAELRLQQHLNQTSDKLAALEVNRAKGFIASVTERKVDQIQNNIKTGSMSLQQGKEEIDRFLTGIDMPPEKTEIFRKTLQRAAESARLENLRTTNPAQFMRETQRFLPNSPTDKAQGIHRLIIEQAKAYGVDPTLALTVAKIESGFNPNLGGKGTIKGLMQLTRAERIRIGARLGLSEDQMNDPAANAAAFAIIAKEAQQRLEANGLPVNNTTIWMQHFLGPGGAMAFMRADPNADAFSLYRSIAGPSIASQAFRNNGDLLVPGLTVGQVLSRIQGRVKRAEGAVSEFVQRDPAAKMTDKLEIMGEKFELLTPLDLAPQAVQATAETVKRNEAALTSAVRNNSLYGTEQNSANIYDAVWRKQHDDAAKLDKAGERIMAGDVDTIAKYTAFADRTGYLPKPISAAVLGLINSKDRLAQYKGYELAARIVRANPTDGLRLSGIGGDTDADGANNAAKVRDYVNLTVHGGFGNDDEGRLEAMRRVELRHSPDFQIKERDIKGRLEKEVQARSWGEIESAFNTSGSWLWGRPDTGPPNPGLRQMMEARYQEFYRFHRNNNATQDIAKANALADLNRAHNFTRIFGEKSYMMPYPPEFNYPPTTPLPLKADGTPKRVSELSIAERKERYGYIVDQALGYAQQAAKRNGDKNADKLTAADVVLVPDGLTKRDVEAGTAPRYTVAYKRGSEWFTAMREFRADPEAARHSQTTGGESRTGNTPTIPSVQQENARDKFRAGRGGN